MKTNKVFLMTVLIAGIIGSAYGMGQVDKIGEKAKQANENVRKINEVIRDADETVEGVGGAKEGVKDIAKDSGDVVGIDPSRPAQNAGQTEPVIAAQSGGGTAGIIGTWEYKSRFSPGRFEFTPDRYAFYRGSGSSPHTSGKYTVSGGTVQLFNESGYDWETITINGNSFEFWGSTFTKQ
jgi:hypothetical protein